jgi:hypothetical protein
VGYERGAPKKWEFGVEPEDNGPRCGPAEHAAAVRYLTRTGNADLLDVLGLPGVGDRKNSSRLGVQPSPP